MKVLKGCLLAAAFAVSFAPAAQSQSFPVKPIRLIVNLPPGTAADLVARTLAPRRHRNVSPSRLIALEFNGRRVKGSIGPVDVPSLPIDTTLAIAPFDSGNWDLIVRSLPLEKGYAARFRVYDTDSGLREYRIDVTGSATVLGEEAHVVIFTLAPKRESVVWIGKESRRLLQVETMIDANTMLRQERQRR